MDYSSLLSQLEQCLYELSEDSRMVRAGLATEAHSEAILKKYPEISSEEAVRFTQTLWEQETDESTKDRYKRVHFLTLSFFLEQHIAGLSDKQEAFFAQAETDIEGKKVSYYNLSNAIQKEPDAQKREAIEDARLGIVKEATPISEEILATTLRLLKDTFGYSSYISYVSQKKHMDYSVFHHLLQQCHTELKETYHTHMGRWVEEGLGQKLGEVKKVHASILVNLSRFNEHIKGFTYGEKVMEMFRSMHLDFAEYPNIKVDLSELDSKNPRACCYSAKVPDEIHLLVKPTEKLTDYETFLHESGHAFHYGCTDRTLPLEFREFGTNYALSETYAFLFEKLMFNPLFLKAQFGFSDEVIKDMVYYHTLTNLWFLIRYIGKFTYEYAFFSSADTPTGDLYAKTLTEYTGFIYSPLGYLDDMDGEFYSADYLRAWIAERQLNHYLETTYGLDWFSKEEAITFINSLWAKGDAWQCEEMIASLGMKPFDVAPLIASYKTVLGA